MFEKMQKTIDFVWDNRYCDFYNEFWKAKEVREKPHLQSLDDFTQLPVCSKVNFQERPNPSERLFIDFGELEMIRSTSGTSGGDPLYFWRDRFVGPELYQLTVNGGGTRAMVFFVYNSAMSSVLPARDVGLELLVGDPHKLEDAAATIAHACVNSLVVTPSIALLLAPLIQKEGATENIVHLTLWGEFTSDETLEQLKEAYPKATYSWMYTLGEASDVIGYATNECTKGNHFVHIRTDAVYIEELDGELVVTNLRVPHAMPLVRYKTGDAVRILDESCDCGDTSPRLEFLGRIGGDFVRIGGGEVRVEEVEKVLAEFVSYVQPVFLGEIREVEERGGRLAQLTLYLSRKDETNEDALDMLIAKSLIEKLRLSPGMRLKDAIAGGIFTDPVVTFKERPPGSYKNKTIRFVTS